jgi:hypothetical protein
MAIAQARSPVPKMSISVTNLARQPARAATAASAWLGGPGDRLFGSVFNSKQRHGPAMGPGAGIWHWQCAVQTGSELLPASY